MAAFQRVPGCALDLNPQKLSPDPIPVSQVLPPGKSEKKEREMRSFFDSSQATRRLAKA